MRINSILEEIGKKNYIEKIENHYYIMYTYDEYDTIYVKEINSKIIEKIKESKFNKVFIYDENNASKKMNKNTIILENLENIEKIIIK
jgi:hypothetical protein